MVTDPIPMVGRVSADDTHDAVVDHEEDLSNEDRQASIDGVRLPHEQQPPPADHIRSVAFSLLLIFGISMVLILLLTTAVAWWRQPALKGT